MYSGARLSWGEKHKNRGFLSFFRRTDLFFLFFPLMVSSILVTFFVHVSGVKKGGNEWMDGWMNDRSTFFQRIIMSSSCSSSTSSSRPPLPPIPSSAASPPPLPLKTGALHHQRLQQQQQQHQRTQQINRYSQRWARVRLDGGGGSFGNFYGGGGQSHFYSGGMVGG